MPTLLTRLTRPSMKRIFDKPLPRTYGDFEHFQSRQKVESDPAPVFIIATACVGLFSAVTLLCCVFMWVIAAIQGEPFSTVETHLYVGLGSACLFLACLLVALVWNRFFKNN